MAKQNTSNDTLNHLSKSLNEDAMFPDNGSWTQARNASLNTVRGNLGGLGSEQSNFKCADVPYLILGAIYIEAGKYVIFSGDDTDSEIGLFNEVDCTYKTIVNDKCLAFDTKYTVRGVSKESNDCTWDIYWDHKPGSRTKSMNIDDVPFIEICKDEIGTVIDNNTPNSYTVAGCIICEKTKALDCSKINLSPLFTNLCFNVKASSSGGQLPNGSYFVVGAYLEDGQKVSDYSIPSNVQGLFSHQNNFGSLDIIVDNADTYFEYFELIVVRAVNNQVTAKKIGEYSTSTRNITLDIIFDSLETVSIDYISLRTPVVNLSKDMFSVGGVLMRVGPELKFDFNYQPLANQIETQFVVTKYPANYYVDGGTKTSYLRNEVYPFFIRWVYDTGDVSSSYHIPGRAKEPSDNGTASGSDADYDNNAGTVANKWDVYNTAKDFITASDILDDGGEVVLRGKMGYWESTEKYPDKSHDVWDASSNPIWGSSLNAHDLCGEVIRHHKMPANYSHSLTNHYTDNGESILLLGVEFDNIKAPLDNNGVPIDGIVGYEILRGSRDGNRSIIAKGMLNNMRGYDLPSGVGNRKGLYPNYPFNPLLNDEFFMTDFNNGSPLSTVHRDVFTFHSPETNFRDIFLGVRELVIDGEFGGDADIIFNYPENHPKHVLVTDIAFIIGMISGIVYAAAKLNGVSETTTVSPRAMNSGFGMTLAGVSSGVASAPFSGPIPMLSSVNAAIRRAAEVGKGAGQIALQEPGLNILASIVGFNNVGPNKVDNIANYAEENGMFWGQMGGYKEVKRSSADNDAPTILKVIGGINRFLSYTSEASDKIMEFIRAVMPLNQHALQSMAHGFYSKYKLPTNNDKSRLIDNIGYLDSGIQDFGTNYRINNLYRSRTVALSTTSVLKDTIGNDYSMQTLGTVTGDFEHPIDNTYIRPISSHYVSLRNRIDNQYGQIESISQVHLGNCMHDKSEVNSGVIFGGDIYINRYTEKNTMFMFHKWLDGEPDRAQFNYRNYPMLAAPKYYMDTSNFSTYSFMADLISKITSLDFSNFSSIFPSGAYKFDKVGTPFLVYKNSYIYLFVSGVRDFFVESEINVANRDWEDKDSSRHFDSNRYTDLRAIFNSRIIKSGNYYKYDYSLSISKLFSSRFSWGTTHPRTYDPYDSDSCYRSVPNRVMYSLPQVKANTKDYWRVFLPANKKDFKSRVLAIKQLNENGALFLFENNSPQMINGTATMRTSSDLSITLGDNQLFNKPVSRMSNADDQFEYGSCQNRLSVIDTPFGLFYMSLNQGKIFRVTQNLNEISMGGIAWWLTLYMPYKLTEEFPDFELVDNPISGIGCQATYDSESKTVFFSKKDYVVRKDIKDKVTYTGKGYKFLVNGILSVDLGDPRYFADASWTLSYDALNSRWIGYHDWHPNLSLPGRINFSTVKGKAIWKHNEVCDSFCNFYGTDFPFEVEYTVANINTINILRSVEYSMEVFEYKENCYDRYHVLDEGFDEAIIYNSEQTSGLLKLNISPKNGSTDIVGYPKINTFDIDILYSKEEHKYRFNQFFDVTKDRGEFTNTNETVFNTEENGYIRVLNNDNIDYQKDEFERKRIRHYKNVILLRRKVCGNKNFVFIAAKTKNTISIR